MTDEPSAGERPQDERKEVPKHKYRPWLLMLYMTVDAPNLERPMDVNLDELRRALDGASPEAARCVYVIVQIDYPSGIYKRYWLKRKKAKLLKAGTVDHTSGVASFVNEVAACFDARYRALVMWGHSAGVAESMEVPGVPMLSAKVTKTVLESMGQLLTALPKRAKRMSRSFLDIVLKNLSSGGISNSISQLQTISVVLDLVGFDACFMAMAELAYELRKKVCFLLAPQASIGLQGWHYDLLLDHILHGSEGGSCQKAPIDPSTLGQRAIQQVGLRSSSPQSLTLLKLRERKSPEAAESDRPRMPIVEVRDKFKVLVTELIDALGDPHAEMNLRHQVLAAFDSALWAGARQFLDLHDLCRQLATRIPVPCVRKAALDVSTALNELVVDQLSTLDLPLGGVSIYCPWVRATMDEVDGGVRNVEVDLFTYLGLRFVWSTRYWALILHPSNLVPAERHWIRREVRESTRAAAAEAAWRFGANGREPDPKPGSREPDPKPGGREPDPKPGSRAPDPKPAGRGGEGRGDYYY